MTFAELAATLDGIVRAEAAPEYGGKPLGNTVSWRSDPQGRNRSAVIQLSSPDRITLDLYVKNDPVGDRLEFVVEDGALDRVGNTIAAHLAGRNGVRPHPEAR